MNEEIRSLPMPEEYRVKQEGGEGESNRLVGYALLYNTPSNPIYDPDSRSTYVEILQPGCFTRSLAENPDIRAYVAHDKKKILGRVGANTLGLEPDGIGMKFWLDLDDTSHATDLKKSIRRKDLDGVSFGMKNVKSTIRKGGKYPLRIVHEATLTEISPGVDRPAYSEAVAELRSLELPPEPVPTPILDAARRRTRLAGVDVRKQ